MSEFIFAFQCNGRLLILHQDVLHESVVRQSDESIPQIFDPLAKGKAYQLKARHKKVETI